MGYLILFIFPFLVHAKEYYPSKYFDGTRLVRNQGEVTVLEAPVFRDKDINSKVIFYFRKGDVINIHPAEFTQNRYQNLIGIDDKEVEKYKEQYIKDFPDKFFDEEHEVYYPEPGSKYYKVLLKSGRTGWILKEHIFRLTADKRELNEVVIDKDNTDYRIEEPLPEGFPLLRDTGYRGIFNFGLGTARTPNYPFTENVDQSAYGFSKTFDFYFMRKVKYDNDNRFYFGGLISLLSYSNTYELRTRTATEDYTNLSIGPTILYDLWKTEEHILSLVGGIQFNFVNFARIKQKDEENRISEEREFNSYFFTPRFSLIYSNRGLLKPFDFVMGTNIMIDLKHNYSSTTGGARNQDWWQGNDYERATNVQTNYFLGLQTNY